MPACLPGCLCPKKMNKKNILFYIYIKQLWQQIAWLIVVFCCVSEVIMLTICYQLLMERVCVYMWYSAADTKRKLVDKEWWIYSHIHWKPTRIKLYCHYTVELCDFNFQKYNWWKFWEKTHEFDIFQQNSNCSVDYYISKL